MRYQRSVDLLQSLVYLPSPPDIAPGLQVFRFSKSKLIDYLRNKVSRLATAESIESSRTLLRNLAKDGLMEDGKEDLLQGLLFATMIYLLGLRSALAARLKAGCDLISQYLPLSLYGELLSSYEYVRVTCSDSLFSKPYSFTNLDAYLKILEGDTAALSTANSNRSKTKSKPSEKDSGKKRKSKTSQGVDKLKKANTDGMAKLSTFFKKAS